MIRDLITALRAAVKEYKRLRWRRQRIARFDHFPF